jgi:hypothetical protein
MRPIQLYLNKWPLGPVKAFSHSLGSLHGMGPSAVSSASAELRQELLDLGFDAVCAETAEVICSH